MTTVDVVPTTPKWLTDNFLRNCLSGDGVNAQEYPINNIQLKYAVPKGENFLSVMVRVIINGKGEENGMNSAADTSENYQPEEKRYILKVGHTEGELKKLSDSVDSFPKETDMYVNLIPALHSILQSAGITSRFGCRCLYAEKENDVIVLEDLTQLGYKVEDRIKGLDLQHCQLVIYKLALLHASSMRYFETISLDDIKPFYFDYALSDGHISDDVPLKSPTFLTNNVKLFAKDLKQRLGYEKESEYIENISDKFHHMFQKILNIKKGGMFNTLIHGDLWINNMMFKNDAEGRVLDVILLDLQLSSYNTIAWDFIYFMVTSPCLEVLNNHFNDLVHYYLENLKVTLLKLGYGGSLPTVDQFKEEMRNKSILFIYNLAQVMPFLKNQINEEDKSRDKEDTIKVTDFEKLTSDTRRSSVYQNHIFAVVDLMRRENLFFPN